MPLLSKIILSVKNHNKLDIWKDIQEELIVLFKRLTLEIERKLYFTNLTQWHVDVLLSDSSFVQDLNYKYRGKRSPTNVISFPQIVNFNSLLNCLDKKRLLGDIVLCWEVIKVESFNQNKLFIHHIAHLFVHGLLHLFCFNHKSSNDSKCMEDIEISTLGMVGISNPYQDNLN